MTSDVAAISERIVITVTRRRVFRDVFELSLVAFAFLLYFLVRGSVVDRAGEAFGNANEIIRLEKDLGIFWEPRLQELILGNKALIQLWNAVYFWLDFPVIIIIGLWLYFWHRHEYTVARDAILISGAIALIIYNLYPVAPPRLTSGFDFVGTVEEYSNFSYQAQSMQAFVNPYAAVPSLHYGWSVLVGGALLWTARHWLLRGFGLVLPFAQLASIVLTANHFILDAPAGLAVGLAGLLLAMALQRWGYAWLRREVEQRFTGRAAREGIKQRA